MTELNKCCGENPVFWVPAYEVKHLNMSCLIKCEKSHREVFDVDQVECANKWNSLDVKLTGSNITLG